jgi:hypothetical protein
VDSATIRETGISRTIDAHIEYSSAFANFDAESLINSEDVVRELPRFRRSRPVPQTAVDMSSVVDSLGSSALAEVIFEWIAYLPVRLGSRFESCIRQAVSPT